jgi:hypothetical protein
MDASAERESACWERGEGEGRGRGRRRRGGEYRLVENIRRILVNVQQEKIHDEALKENT